MREINVSHAGDKALTRETPMKGGGLTGMCIRVSGRSDPKSIRPHLKRSRLIQEPGQSTPSHSNI